jgi:hypothetical protein
MRADGHEFLALAPEAKVRTTTTPCPLDKANEGLDDLRSGRLEGAAVLVPWAETVALPHTSAKAQRSSQHDLE